jgi:hypothetical protein
MMGLRCDQPIRIPGTQPPAVRPCKHSAAEGETKCARHGGKPMRPRQARSLWRRIVQWVKG